MKFNFQNLNDCIFMLCTMLANIEQVGGRLGGGGGGLFVFFKPDGEFLFTK